MRKGSSRSRLLEAERRLGVGDAKAALTEAEELAAERPQDARILGLVGRAAAELGRWELALESSRSLRQIAGDAGRILEAEVLLAAERLPEARDVLADAAPENLVAAGLRQVLDLFEELGHGPTADRGSPPPHGEPTGAEPNGERLSPELFWFEASLTALLFLSERCLREQPASAELHTLRTSLLEVNVPEAFRSRHAGPIEFLVERFQPEVRARRQRCREIAALIDRDEIDQVVDNLRRWFEEEPPASGPDLDDRVALLALTLAFRNRFDEALPIVEKGGVDRWIRFDRTYALVRGYAQIAGGKPDAALRSLRDSFASGDPASAYLLGVANLHAGHAERAWGWFRRTFQTSDIDAVELARGELRLLGVGSDAASPAATDDEPARNPQPA